MDLEKKLQEIVKRNNILKNEPMSKHTSLKIGGIADYFIKVKTVDELKKLLEFTTENKIKRAFSSFYFYLLCSNNLLHFES